LRPRTRIQYRFSVRSRLINAINRGFSPERAFEMIEDEDLLLDVIDLSAMAEGPRQLESSPGQDYREGWSGPGTD